MPPDGVSLLKEIRMGLNVRGQTVYTVSQDVLDDVLMANHLIDEFLLFMKEDEIGNDLIDEIELPVQKNALVEAFRIAIAAERQPTVRALLIKAGMTLAQFRIGLGNRIRLTPLTPHGRSPQLRSCAFERRLERILIATAEERVHLCEFYRRVCVQSYN
ncbi:hypothetical protein LPU83_pLPU83c_0575 (plasmid) [Rhizobium favelukesii]|uniref:Uncharacterized protein n=2 Tax=Rhizobium/Agrobacterium group TaxID=227290 RepID=W6RJ03_9HYPH|nr:hypothetical protein LPU83_pLPU83c_0575 [Rhizobium favelukesii]